MYCSKSCDFQNISRFSTELITTAGLLETMHDGMFKNAKAGQIRFRTDKNGIIHGGIGKISFELDAIKGNLEAVLADLKKGKPAAAKGVYLKKITLSTTMGPGVTIDQASLEE